MALLLSTVLIHLVGFLSFKKDFHFWKPLNAPSPYGDSTIQYFTFLYLYSFGRPPHLSV